MQTKSKIFLGLALLLIAALLLVFLLKSPSREPAAVESAQSPASEDLQIDSLAEFNLSHV